MFVYIQLYFTEFYFILFTASDVRIAKLEMQWQNGFSLTTRPYGTRETTRYEWLATGERK